MTWDKVLGGIGSVIGTLLGLIAVLAAVGFMLAVGAAFILACVHVAGEVLT